ncbi:unnamed protein product, partial [Staurois parvus]
TSGEPASFPGGSAGVPILLVPGKPFYCYSNWSLNLTLNTMTVRLDSRHRVIWRWWIVWLDRWASGSPGMTAGTGSSGTESSGLTAGTGSSGI